MSTRLTPRSDQTPSKRRFSGETPKGNQSSVLLKIKESAAELKNFLQQWNKLQSTGSVVLSSIKSLKLHSMRNGDPEENYPEGLQERCDQLQDVIDTMASCLDNLSILVQQFSALVQLDSFQGGANKAVCLSWSTEKFSQAFQDIYEAYAKELKLKETIKDEVAHCIKKEALIFHITSWTVQPFIGSTCQLLCECLLCESDIR